MTPNSSNSLSPCDPPSAVSLLSFVGHMSAYLCNTPTLLHRAFQPSTCSLLNSSSLNSFLAATAPGMSGALERLPPTLISKPRRHCGSILPCPPYSSIPMDYPSATVSQKPFLPPIYFLTAMGSAMSASPPASSSHSEVYSSPALAPGCKRRPSPTTFPLDYPTVANLLSGGHDVSQPCGVLLPL